MKIHQIILSETTTAGAVATVSKPMGETQKRPSVRGLEPAEKVMSGKSKKKGPYANSISEAKKDFAAKLAGNVAKANKGKKDTEEKVKQHQQQPKDKVQEAKLDEDDLILVPGHGMKRKTGFVPHGQSRVDHEVEMARSDVLATMKNAKAIYELLKDKSEDEGIEGWVQEKLIKANDYLNSVKEYYDEKMMHEMNAGVIAAGGVGEGVAEGSNSSSFDQMANLKSKSNKELDELVKFWQRALEKNPNHKVANDQLHIIKMIRAERIGKKGVAEGAPELLKAEMPLVRHIERELADKGWQKSDDGYDKVFSSAMAMYRKFGNVDAIKKQGVAASAGEQKYMAVYNKHIGNPSYIGKPITSDGKVIYVTASSKEEASSKFVEIFNRAQVLSSFIGRFDVVPKDESGEQGVAEGAKVDRMVQHIKKSEIKTGKSKDEAENIAWATVNKRGYLDNKKKGK